MQLNASLLRERSMARLSSTHRLSLSKAALSTSATETRVRPASRTSSWTPSLEPLQLSPSKLTEVSRYSNSNHVYSNCSYSYYSNSNYSISSVTIIITQEHAFSAVSAESHNLSLFPP